MVLEAALGDQAGGDDGREDDAQGNQREDGAQHGSRQRRHEHDHRRRHDAVAAAPVFRLLLAVEGAVEPADEAADPSNGMADRLEKRLGITGKAFDEQRQESKQN